MKKFVLILLSLSVLYPSNSVKTVYKKILNNGLTILVNPSPLTSDVAVYMFYGVGSRDEKTNEKGLAHLLEHMIFKGTKKLSETDIPMTAQLLSAHINAFTSYDKTCYTFSLPKRHWDEALPILADCMVNCTFKDDHLNSEFKAVLQELKMGRDQSQRLIFQSLILDIFHDHPYHHPIIGYKQDIWNVRGKDLHAFYKQHYIPNNAVLVIVGDVNPDVVFDQVEKNFSNIPADWNYKREAFHHEKDINSKSTKIYRDVSHPILTFAFYIPGLKFETDFYFEALLTFLTEGKNSRLYKEIVENKKLAYEVNGGTIILEEGGIFVVQVQLGDLKKAKEIKQIFFNELENIVKNGIEKYELKTLLNKKRSADYDFMENNAEKARAIGEYYLATKDENYIFKKTEITNDDLQQNIIKLIKQYLRPAIMYQVKILPIQEDEKEFLLQIKKDEDARDNLILNQRIRESSVEEPNYAKNIKPKEITSFDYIEPQTIILDNGLKVFIHEQKNSPKINILINFNNNLSSKNNFLYNLACSVASKGTSNYTADQIYKKLEGMATSLSLSKNGISMFTLTDKFIKSLKILDSILKNPTFDQNEIDKEKEKLSAQRNAMLKNPSSVLNILINKNIYDENSPLYPYINSEEEIKGYTKEDIVNAYNEIINMSNMYAVVCGDFTGIDLYKTLNDTIGKLKINTAQTIDVINPKKIETNKVEEFLPVEQVYLAKIANSINIDHPKLYEILLGSLILSDGSLNSRLFKLREETGLFYYINGSLVPNADKSDGLIYIHTIISPENVYATEQLIHQTLQNFASNITEEELAIAKNTLLQEISHLYEKRTGIVAALSKLYFLNRPWDFYKNLPNKIKSITLEDVKAALTELLNDKEFLTVKVGRVS